MNLAQLQEQLRQMIKYRRPPSPDDEAYLRAIYDSGPLHLVREIALWWRAFQLEQYCPLTSGLLQQRGAYEEWIDRFYRETNVSSFIEQAGQDFLAYLAGAGEIAPDLRALAGFERALIAVKMGARNTFTIHWPCEPYALLSIAMGKRGVVPETGCYETTVAHDLPGWFVVRTSGRDCA